MKSILFKINLKGRGIVNFDDSNQKYKLSKSEKTKHLYHRHENVKYSKKHFYEDEDGIMDYKIKISSSCIRKGLFNDIMVGQNTNFINNENLLLSQIASPYFILNGYLFTSKGRSSIKRKSSITICDAIQTNNSISMLECKTRSGYKETDGSDTTLFSEETIGDITYTTDGFIDLSELQFISLDDYYDRISFNPDLFDIYKKFIKTNIPSFDSKVGYYKIKNSVNSFPELGLKFSKDDVDYLVKYFLERIPKLLIRRNHSYVKFDSLEIKIVENAITDTFENPNNWIKISSIDDISSIKFLYDDKYIEVDEDEAKKIKNTFKEELDNKKDKSIEKNTKKPTKKKEVAKKVDE